MRILYLYCHPLDDSFHAAIMREAVASLRAKGHEVDLCDLMPRASIPSSRLSVGGTITM